MKHHIFYTAVLLAVITGILFFEETKIPVIAKPSVGSLASGKWGTCSWEIYNDGSLVIEQGTGEGQPLGATLSPWSTYASQIKSINFSGKVIAPSNCCSLFRSLSNVAEITNAKDFDTGNVTNMGNMFDSCYALTTLDVSGWNTGNVTDMSYMFSGCYALTTLDVSGWDTSNVTYMDRMFYNCSKLASLDVSGWDTSNVRDMNKMFYNCSKLASLDVSGWNTGNVKDMSDMFDNCRALTSLDVSNWNTGNVTNMNSMFSGCNNLTTLDVSGWNTSKVTNMGSMFSSCIGLTTLDVSGWNTSNVTDMSYMFSGCKALTTLNASGWNTSNVTNMNKMFYNCSALTTLDVSGWNTGKVTNMSGMFSGCNSLNTIYFGTKWTKSLSAAYFPSATDWQKKRDTDGTRITDKTTYNLSGAKIVNSAVVVPSTADSSKTTALAGTWKRGDALYHDVDDDGDETYISKNIISGGSGDTDSDTDEEWVRNGNVWTYTFNVTDDSKTYYVTEDGTDGYTATFKSTGNSTDGVINDKDKNPTRAETVTNTRHDFGSLKITLAVTGSGLPSGYADTMFTFTVTLTDRSSNALSGALICGDTIFNNGTTTVQASVNSPVTISGIPQGYHYTVHEADAPAYTESGDVSGTIAADKTLTAAFTNTYNAQAEKETGGFVLTKKITGRYGDTVPDETYSFEINFSGLGADTSYTVRKSDGTSQTITTNSIGAASADISLKADETASCAGLPETSKYVITEKAGEYTASYAVTEAAGGTGAIASASGANTEENTDLSTAEETVESGETEEIVFTNDIEKTQSLTVLKFTGTGSSAKDTDTNFDFTEDKANTTKDSFSIRFYNLREGDSFNSTIGKFYAMDPADADDISAGADENTWTAEKNFELAEGESVTFSGIPVGVKYVVTESDSPCDVQITTEGKAVVSAVKTEGAASEHKTAVETVDYGEDGKVTFKNRIGETASLQIIKQSITGTRLPNAVFTLYKAGDDGAPVPLYMNTAGVIQDTAGDGLVSCTLTTGETGYSNIVTGLAAGTYILKETSVPAGYTAVEDLSFKIEESELGTTKKLTIRDDKLIELPNTGGPGTILTGAAAAAGMAVFLAVLLMGKRRKSGRSSM